MRTGSMLYPRIKKPATSILAYAWRVLLGITIAVNNISIRARTKFYSFLLPKCYFSPLFDQIVLQFHYVKDLIRKGQRVWDRRFDFRPLIQIKHFLGFIEDTIRGSYH